MKIGFDVSQTCVEKGGCGYYADSLVRAMVGLAPQNEYVLYHHFGEWVNADTSEGTHIAASCVSAPQRHLSAREAAFLWQGVGEGEALGDDPEIVHACNFQAPAIPKAKLVYTVYDMSYWVCPEFTTEANRLVCQNGLLAALERAHGFVFISENSHAEFERVLAGWLGERGKPWCVTPLAARHARPASRPAGKPAYWLSVGSLEPRKNHRALLDALDIYWSRSADPKPLWVAGGRGWKSEGIHERLAVLEREGKAVYLGYVPDERLQVVYADAAALVFPSWHEGFGLPVIEAMRHGCAVISSDRASLPEVGGDAALYIDPESPEQIAQAMLRLEQEPGLLSQRREMGRVQAERFTWERTARLTLDFYRRVLAGS